MLFLVFFVQIILTSIIILTLRFIFDRDLMSAALEDLQSHARTDVLCAASVQILASRPLSPVQQDECLAVVQEKFPGCQVEFLINPSIQGGMVIQAGELLLDYSMSGRLDYLFGKKQ